MIFRQFDGLFPMPVWFETGIPQSWAWTLLAPYISSCPANTTRLAWQNFPALTIDNQPNPAKINPNLAPAENSTGANPLSTSGIANNNLCASSQEYCRRLRARYHSEQDHSSLIRRKTHSALMGQCWHADRTQQQLRHVSQSSRGCAPLRYVCVATECHICSLDEYKREYRCRCPAQRNSLHERSRRQWNHVHCHHQSEPICDALQPVTDQPVSFSTNRSPNTFH